MIRFRPLRGPTLWFVPAFAFMLGLGFWQIERLEQKNTLIATIAAGLAADPVPLDEAFQGGLPQAEWRHITVAGRFLHDRETYLFSRGPDAAIGVDILTPLARDNGETVLIDRGFVPEPLRDPAMREAGQVTGPVSVRGVVRLAQTGGMFTPAPDLATRLWFVKDVPAMAEGLGLSVPPILIVADSAANPGGWPLGRETIIDVPNDHLQYAITWFLLALTLLAVYLLYHRSRGRLSAG